MFVHTKGLVPEFYVGLLNKFEQEVMPYDRGPCHYTTTALSRGPLEAQLAKRHPDVEKEALDGIASVDGTMLHLGLEMAARRRGDKCEVRRFILITLPDGTERVFSGCNDHETKDVCLGKVMTDWKRTKSYSLVWMRKPGRSSIFIEGQFHKQDWVNQLNINRWLAESEETFTYPDEFLAWNVDRMWPEWKCGFLDEVGRPPTQDDFAQHEFFVSRRIPDPVWKPDRMFVGAILKDWDKKKAQREKDYPKTPVRFVEIPWLDNADITDYMTERMTYHEEWSGIEPKQIPPCSAKERWQDDDVWKVFDATSKAKSPRSKGNVATQNEAEILQRAEIERTGKPHRIEFFPAVPLKCARYCDVREHCYFGKEHIEEDPWDQFTS